MFSIGSFAIIKNPASEVLLCLRRDRDMWNLPGGLVESRESPWDAATREVFEETTLEIEIDELLGVFHKDYEDDLVFLFSGIIKNGLPESTEESKSVRFFPLTELPENLFTPHRERILSVNNLSCTPLLMTQTT